MNEQNMRSFAGVWMAGAAAIGCLAFSSCVTKDGSTLSLQAASFDRESTPVPKLRNIVKVTSSLNRLFDGDVEQLGGDLNALRQLAELSQALNTQIADLAPVTGDVTAEMTYALESISSATHRLIELRRVEELMSDSSLEHDTWRAVIAEETPQLIEELRTFASYFAKMQSSGDKERTWFAELLELPGDDIYPIHADKFAQRTQLLMLSRVNAKNLVSWYRSTADLVTAAGFAHQEVSAKQAGGCNEWYAAFRELAGVFRDVREQSERTLTDSAVDGLILRHSRLAKSDFGKSIGTQALSDQRQAEVMSLLERWSDFVRTNFANKDWQTLRPCL